MCTHGLFMFYKNHSININETYAKVSLKLMDLIHVL